MGPRRRRLLGALRRVALGSVAAVAGSPRLGIVFTGVGLGGLLGACEAPAPPPGAAAIPEPTEALRPLGARGEIPEDARIADYAIDVRLDAERHRITGKARLTWRNRSGQTVRRLPFHLYMNAFRAEDTVWMREGRGSHRGQRQGSVAWGYIEIHAVTLIGTSTIAEVDAAGDSRAEPVAGSGAARELVWAEDADPTTMTVDLGETAIGPGEVAILDLEFTTQLPEVFARTGYADDFHMVGQWYPKIGVLEPDRGFVTPTFNYNSEFYADFGSYEVTLDVPAAMVVGATGILVGDDEVGSEEGGGTRRRLRYRADYVHDFAWVADPALVEVREEFEGIRIRQLMRRERLGDAELHAEALRATITSMEARFGPYPWSTITVVHPPDDAGGAQGMEYPTLFTSSPIIGRTRPLTAGLLALIGFEERLSGVFTTVHEYGHQYFQGLLASNEFAEPWLDEGMNTTANALTLLDWRGEDAWVLRLGAQELTDSDLTALSLLRRADLDPVRQPAEAFLSITRTYGQIVYRKTAAVMLTLRNLGGAAAFDGALRVYADTWRMRHPQGDDLIDLLIREIGPTVTLGGDGPTPVVWELRDFLEQALETTDTVDFSLLEVRNRRRIGDAGWRRDADGVLVDGDGDAPEQAEANQKKKEKKKEKKKPLAELDDTEVEAVVIVRREGGLRMPVELAVEFADGGEERLWWDGRGSYRVFVWPGRRVRQAVVDPEGANLLDPRRSNNRRVASGAGGPDDALAPAVADAAEIASLALSAGFAGIGGLAL